LEARLAEAAAERRGVRLIAADRPGYGLSDFRPGRRISDWSGDVEALADALGLGRFGVLGVSGGGPYAVACAASLPARVTAAGIVGGLGKLDIREDVARLNAFARFSFALARRAPALSQLFNRALAPVLRNNPRWTLKLLASELPPPDRQALSDPAAFSIIADSLREAFRQGGRAAALDLTLYAQPWDAAPGSIRVPCYVWHGEQDTTVPVAMGRRLAAAIPGCRAEYYADEGHFSLPVRRMDEILAALT
jgi:pimeloyl-ACP methyl ester carboxylesterase